MGGIKAGPCLGQPCEKKRVLCTALAFETSSTYHTDDK